MLGVGVLHHAYAAAWKWVGITDMEQMSWLGPLSESGQVDIVSLLTVSTSHYSAFSLRFFKGYSPVHMKIGIAFVMKDTFQVAQILTADTAPTFMVDLAHFSLERFPQIAAIWLSF